VWSLLYFAAVLTACFVGLGGASAASTTWIWRLYRLYGFRVQRLSVEGFAVRTAPSINSLSTWPSLLFTRVLAVPTERNRQPEPAYCYEWLKPYRSPSALSAPSTLVPRPCHATIRA
jgi:hypothetical protein